MTYETIIYEQNQGVAVVTLNRPERMNALSFRLKEEVHAVLDEIERDDEVRVVILTGGVKAFSSGADIKERAGVQLTQAQFYSFQRKSQSFYTRIEDFEKPVIAAVSGVAVGGGLELALVCDLRIASETARFGLPEVRIGVMPAAGGTQRLPRLIGSAHAKKLIFTGEFIDVHEAYRIGLVNEVVPVDELMDRAVRLARKIAGHPPLSLKYAKRAVNAGIQLDLASGLDYEAQCVSVLYTSEDRQEGMTAFREKRKPVFTGR